MSWRQRSFHLERALLERCPDTLLHKRVSERLKVIDLILPNCGFRPITTLVAAASAAPAQPRYTSLAEIIPTESGASVVESVGTPRTPMRNRLVEKAARAYLLPSDSFSRSRLNNATHLPHQHQHFPWTQSFARFLPALRAHHGAQPFQCLQLRVSNVPALRHGFPRTLHAAAGFALRVVIFLHAASALARSQHPLKFACPKNSVRFPLF